MGDEKNSNHTGIPVFYTSLNETEFREIIKDEHSKAFLEMFDRLKGLVGSNALDENELLTREEAAETFKVSIATIDNYRRQGLIVPCRIGGIVRFKRSELQAAFSGSIVNPYKTPAPNKRKSG